MPARSLKICTGLRAALVFTDVGEMAKKKKKKKAGEDSWRGEKEANNIGQCCAIWIHFTGRLMFMLIFSSSAKCCWNPVTFSLNLERTSIFSASKSFSFCTYRSRS